MEKDYIKINGHNVAVIDTKVGKKTAFVLHGWGAHIESVMPIVNSLKDRYRVIAYDALGHGNSDEPTEVMGTADYATFLEDVVNYYNVESAVFVGHSFGGKTLTIYAANHPEKVEKLVLIDASGVMPKRGIDYYLKVYSFKALKGLYQLIFFWKEKSKRLEAFYSKFGSDDYQASQGIMRKVFVKVVNESTRDYLPKIKAETLLIWGREDDATPLYMAEVFEQEIPNAGLVVLNGGHYSYIDDFATFRAVMTSFL